MLKNWLLYGLSLGGTLLFHAFYYGWYSWFVLMLAIVLPLFSLLVSIPAMLRMRLTMELPRQCVRDDQIYLSLRGSCGRLPMPLCRFRLTMTNRLSGHAVSVRQKLPGGGRWYIAPDTTHCGLLICTVDRSRVYDYLGLFSIPVHQTKQVAAYICPEPEQPDPMPNLSRFLVTQRRPKPGGGFSEEHELREYRAGDHLRDIHWKLSVKTDSMIVREAQEPVRSRVLLTLDLSGTAARLDSLLSRLLWLSEWLLDHETPHQIIWVDPDDCNLVCTTIETPDHLRSVLRQMLAAAPRQDLPSIAHRQFGSAAWRYHLQPEQEAAP